MTQRLIFVCEIRSSADPITTIAICFTKRETFTPGQSATTHRASTDFSGVQGPNWYYLDSNGTPLTFLTQWG